MCICILLGKLHYSHILHENNLKNSLPRLIYFFQYRADLRSFHRMNKKIHPCILNYFKHQNKKIPIKYVFLIKSTVDHWTLDMASPPHFSVFLFKMLENFKNKESNVEKLQNLLKNMFKYFAFCR